MEWQYTADGKFPTHGGQVLVSYTLYQNGPWVQSARYEGGKWDFGSPFTNPDVVVYAWKTHEAAAPVERAKP
jgi:hypothetical protein